MNTEEKDVERLNGKCIMAIKYIIDQHERDDRYPRSIDHFENLARWMEYSVEDVRNLDNICDMLSISGMAWHIVLREKGNYVELTQAKEICEDNIENMFIIGVHSKDIYEKCKILRERAERKGEETMNTAEVEAERLNGKKQIRHLIKLC